MHEKAEGVMFNYNNSLVVESLFFFPVVRESRGLTLALCARKLHVASLPITARTLTTETSLQYWLKRLLSWSEGVAHILAKAYEQVLHFVMPPMGKSVFQYIA